MVKVGRSGTLLMGCAATSKPMLIVHTYSCTEVLPNHSKFQGQFETLTSTVLTLSSMSLISLKYMLDARDLLTLRSIS